MDPKYVREWNAKQRHYLVAFTLDGQRVVDRPIHAEDFDHAKRKLKAYYPGQSIRAVRIRIASN